jgi:hypothetical protein
VAGKMTGEKNQISGGEVSIPEEKTIKKKKKFRIRYSRN